VDNEIALKEVFEGGFGGNEGQAVTVRLNEEG
jgi:hypothetical protein